MKIDFNCFIYINVSLNQLFFFYDSVVRFLHLQSSRSRTIRQTSCPSATKTGSVSTNFEDEVVRVASV